MTRQMVVMGVAGCGKTTVASMIARSIEATLGDADDLHPPSNIEAMRHGVPLTDDERAPWLTNIADWLARRAASGTVGVITCSALKRSYRDRLRTSGIPTYFVHLTGSRELLAARIRGRSGHFMPPGLLDSQLAILERLETDENGIELDIHRTPSALARTALETFGGDYKLQ